MAAPTTPEGRRQAATFGTSPGFRFAASPPVAVPAPNPFPPLPKDGILQLVKRVPAVFDFLPDMKGLHNFKQEDARTGFEANLEKHKLKKQRHEDVAAGGGVTAAPIIARPALDHCRFFVDAGRFQQSLGQGGDLRAATTFVVHEEALIAYARAQGFTEIFPQFLTCDRQVEALGPPHVLEHTAAATELPAVGAQAEGDAAEGGAAAPSMPRGPALLKVPEKLPPFQTSTPLTIAQQLVHWFELACFHKTANGSFVVYSPIRLWTAEARSAAKMKGSTEGTRITKASKAYLHVRVFDKRDPAEITANFDVLRSTSSITAAMTAEKGHKDFWSWAAAVATERVRA